GGDGVAGAVTEHHGRTDGPAGPAVCLPGGAGHRIAAGEQAGDRGAVDVEYTPVAIGARAALGAHRADGHRHREVRGSVDRAEGPARWRGSFVVAPVAVV